MVFSLVVAAILLSWVFHDYEMAMNFHCTCPMKSEVFLALSW